MYCNLRVVKRLVSNKAFYQVHRVFYRDEEMREPVCIESSPTAVAGIEAKSMLAIVDEIASAFELETLRIPEWDV